MVKPEGWAASGLFVPLLFLAVWQVLAGTSAGTPAPSDVLGALGRLAERENLPGHIVSSLGRVGTGYALAAALALPLGLTIGLHRGLREFMEPVLGLFRPIPPIAWVPLALLWFGISDTAAIFVITIAAFFPMLVNTVHGALNLNVQHIHAAWTLGARPHHVLFEIVLPGSFPAVLTGLRIGAGLALAVIIAAELVIGFALGSGIGFLFVKYLMVHFNAANIIALMLVVGVIGFLVDLALRLLERRLAGWSAGLALGEDHDG